MTTQGIEEHHQNGSQEDAPDAPTAGMGHGAEQKSDAEMTGAEQEKQADTSVTLEQQGQDGQDLPDFDISQYGESNLEAIAAAQIAAGLGDFGFGGDDVEDDPQTEVVTASDAIPPPTEEIAESSTKRRRSSVGDSAKGLLGPAAMATAVPSTQSAASVTIGQPSSSLPAPSPSVASSTLSNTSRPPPARPPMPSNTARPPPRPPAGPSRPIAPRPATTNGASARPASADSSTSRPPAPALPASALFSATPPAASGFAALLGTLSPSDLAMVAHAAMGLDAQGNPLPGNEESHRALADAMKRLRESTNARPTAASSPTPNATAPQPKPSTSTTAAPPAPVAPAASSSPAPSSAPAKPKPPPKPKEPKAPKLPKDAVKPSSSPPAPTKPKPTPPVERASPIQVFRHEGTPTKTGNPLEDKLPLIAGPRPDRAPPKPGPPPEKRFQCPKCDRAFARAYNLNTHLSTHDPDPNRSKPFPCPYPSCREENRSFSRKHDLQRHIASTHEAEPEPVIEVEEGDDDPMQANLAKLGLGAPGRKFRCECGRAFVRRDALRRHNCEARRDYDDEDDEDEDEDGIHRRSVSTTSHGRLRPDGGPYGSFKNRFAAAANGDLDEDDFETVAASMIAAAREEMEAAEEEHNAAAAAARVGDGGEAEDGDEDDAIAQFASQLTADAAAQLGLVTTTGEDDSQDPSIPVSAPVLARAPAPAAVRARDVPSVAAVSLPIAPSTVKVESASESAAAPAVGEPLQGEGGGGGEEEPDEDVTSAAAAFIAELQGQMGDVDVEGDGQGEEPTMTMATSTSTPALRPEINPTTSTSHNDVPARGGGGGGVISTLAPPSSHLSPLPTTQDGLAEPSTTLEELGSVPIPVGGAKGEMGTKENNTNTNTNMDLDVNANTNAELDVDVDIDVDVPLPSDLGLDAFMQDLQQSVALDELQQQQQQQQQQELQQEEKGEGQGDEEIREEERGGEKIKVEE